ncbi:hypothetical protein [Streptomyces sp. SAS_270]|uniref:hypothetical protein n=1 Tax=Streptomyces sp. SAS_270 TaxID=3412748 RepID=UPI00403D22FA
MPRGRHRHSPPLHRLLPPSAIAGVSLVCAVGPWLFTEPVVLRVLAAGAAATAVVGAVVLRRWDTAAGKRVADLTRARASDEWRFEERVAELETDLDESRELRTKLEQKLRAKRKELAGLRNEHAALLRRYATAETERASVLETRRLLAIEASAPANALPAGLEQVPASAATRGVPVPVPAPRQESDPEPGSDAEAESEAGPAAPAAETESTEPADTTTGADADEATDADETADVDASVEEPSAPEVFSPAGSSLFLRANAALNRFANGAPTAEAKAVAVAAMPTDADATAEPVAGPSEDAVAEEGEAQGKPEAVDGHERAAAEDAAPADARTSKTDSAPAAEPGNTPAAEADSTPSAEPDNAPAAVDAAPQDAPAAEAPAAKPSHPAESVRPSGHFTVPTAVAVVPATPARRPSVEGGFDFFGTQKEASTQALEAVQNEDLADVVGQEALALHKAEAEAVFKPAGEESRGIGQVIDLTAHDETEQINVSQLRSAVS